MQTSLDGIEEKRAKKVMKLAASLGDGESLLTSETLERLGFSRPAAPLLPIPGDEVEGGQLGELETQGAERQSEEIGKASVSYDSGDPSFRFPCS